MEQRRSFSTSAAGNRTQYQVTGVTGQTPVALSMSNTTVNEVETGGAVTVDLGSSAATGTLTLSENGVFLGSTWVSNGQATIILEGFSQGVPNHHCHLFRRWHVRLSNDDVHDKRAKPQLAASGAQPAVAVTIRDRERKEERTVSFAKCDSHRERPCRNARLFRGKTISNAVVLLLAVCIIPAGHAQSQTNPPVLIAPPVVDAIDENNVSILSGEEQFTVPAIKMGDVAFTPFFI